jgi:hypothetical protein
LILLKFYDKGRLIANEKTLMLSPPSPAAMKCGYSGSIDQERKSKEKLLTKAQFMFFE